MTSDFSFDERLAFSKGRRLASPEKTITAMLDGCVSVRTATMTEERVGVDYIATLRGGAQVLIDEKRRDRGCGQHWRHGQPEVALEIWSVVPTGQSRGIAGWTCSESKATDLVLFTFDPIDTANCYLLPFQHLRMAFRRKYAEWRQLFRAPYQSTDGRYQSRCLFVPIDLVMAAIDEVSRLEEDAPPAGSKLPGFD